MHVLDTADTIQIIIQCSAVDTSCDSPRTVSGRLRRKNQHGGPNEKTRYNRQLRISTLGFVSLYVAHMKRLMQPEIKHPALYDYFRRDSFGLLSSRGYRGECE